MKKIYVLCALILAAGAFGCTSGEKKQEPDTQSQFETTDPSIESESVSPDYSFADNQASATETEEEASSPSLGAGSSGRGH